MALDRRLGDIGDSRFLLDGKEFIGFDAHAYLRDECGFTNREAVQFLCSLSRDEFLTKKG